MIVQCFAGAAKHYTILVVITFVNPNVTVKYHAEIFQILMKLDVK